MDFNVLTEHQNAQWLALMAWLKKKSSGSNLKCFPHLNFEGFSVFINILYMYYEELYFLSDDS